jgi:hypothetical protein
MISFIISAAPLERFSSGSSLLLLYFYYQRPTFRQVLEISLVLLYN